MIDLFCWSFIFFSITIVLKVSKKIGYNKRNWMHFLTPHTSYIRFVVQALPYLLIAIHCFKRHCVCVCINDDSNWSGTQFQCFFSVVVFTIVGIVSRHCRRTCMYTAIYELYNVHTNTKVTIWWYDWWWQFLRY